jgi:hypothetical protein
MLGVIIDICEWSSEVACLAAKLSIPTPSTHRAPSLHAWATV